MRDDRRCSHPAEMITVMDFQRFTPLCWMFRVIPVGFPVGFPVVGRVIIPVAIPMIPVGFPVVGRAIIPVVALGCRWWRCAYHRLMACHPCGMRLMGRVVLPVVGWIIIPVAIPMIPVGFPVVALRGTL